MEENLFSWDPPNPIQKMMLRVSLSSRKFQFLIPKLPANFLEGGGRNKFHRPIPLLGHTQHGANNPDTHNCVGNSIIHGPNSVKFQTRNPFLSCKVVHSEYLDRCSFDILSLDREMDCTREILPT